MRPTIRVVIRPVAVLATLGAALAGALGCSSASQPEATAGVEQPIQNCMAYSTGGGSCGGGGSGGGGNTDCGYAGASCCYMLHSTYRCATGLACVSGTCESTTPPPPPTPPLSSGVAWIDANGTCASGQTTGCDPAAHDYGYCTLTGSVAVPSALASSNCTLGMVYGQNGTSYTPQNLFACKSFTGVSGYSALVGYESACVGPIDSGYTLVVNADLSQPDGTGSPTETYEMDWLSDSMPGGGPCLPPYP
jgi:hypothetical protein